MRLLALLLLLTAPARSASYYLTIAGLGGEPEYEQRFTSLAQEIDKLLKASSGGARVETLHGPAATKAKITEILNAFAKSATPQDSTTVILIGHGTFDNVDYKFNIPGPDLSAYDLGGLLDKIPGHQLVINTTSCSGGSVVALKKQGRALITATKAGSEKNATVFARYIAEALRDPAADADKNEAVSALEAYRYANEKTIRFYETQKRIATEHAQLEDTGKSEPVRDANTENGQGLLAARVTLLRLGSAQKAAATPEKRQLLEKKEALEQEIAKLKYQRAAMNSEQYRKQLTQMLLELAKVQAEIDK
ncbi:MAG: caspase family protein [Acidobacteria bacterium]|nr:caspase family protein [Acidobacteriota bacterium]